MDLIGHYKSKYLISLYNPDSRNPIPTALPMGYTERAACHVATTAYSYRQGISYEPITARLYLKEGAGGWAKLNLTSAAHTHQKFPRKLHAPDLPLLLNWTCIPKTRDAVSFSWGSQIKLRSVI